MVDLTITEVRSPRDLDAVRSLMRDYLVWHGQRYEAYRDLLDKYFDYDGYEKETIGLPGRYVRPKGCILIAKENEKPLGCVALRDLGGGVAEMKRMFVAADAQGLGIGKQLAERIMEISRKAGYSAMRLDTGPLQTEAISMYRKLGFDFIEPYYDLPAELGEMLVFMECDLVGSGST